MLVEHVAGEANDCRHYKKASIELQVIIIVIIVIVGPVRVKWILEHVSKGKLPVLGRCVHAISAVE